MKTVIVADTTFRGRPIEILAVYPVARGYKVAEARYLDEIGGWLNDDELQAVSIECAVDVARVWEDYCIACE